MSAYHHYARIRAEMAQATPDNPALFGWRSFSQNDEDGIISEILRKMNIHPLYTNRKDKASFIELACGNGLENNTHQLLLDGFKGVWIDGNSENISFIEAGLSGLEFPNLLARHEFITRENLPLILSNSKFFLNINEIDVFSLDVDGNDLHFAKIIAEQCLPKLFIVEYNGKFPPPRSYTVPYDENFCWAVDDYHGATLQAFIDVLSNYTLVACNISGINAFFVHNSYAHYFTPYSANVLWQPARFFMASFNTQYHISSFKWLRECINNHKP